MTLSMLFDTISIMAYSLQHVLPYSVYALLLTAAITFVVVTLMLLHEENDIAKHIKAKRKRAQGHS